MLSTEVQQINDGYSETGISLRLHGERLRVVTDSNLDDTIDTLGLSVDGGEFFPADRIVDATDLLFENQVSAIVEAFIRGSKADLKLRFWPTWPTTGSKTVTVSLLGFTQAHKAFADCN